MANKYTGVAVIHGFPGGISYSGVGTFIKNSGTIEHQIEVADVTDDDNDLVSLLHSKESYTFTLRVIARAATGTPASLASAQASMALPAQGSVVTLSGFPAPSGGGDYINQANWVYVGGSWDFSKDGVMEGTITIRRSATHDISTQPSA